METDAFYDLPSLVKLDLRNNDLCQIGNILSALTHEDLVVDLAENRIKYLVEAQYKPYIETRKNKGYINLGGNSFSCQCDMKWLLATNFQWNDLLINGTCADGRSMDQV